MSIFFVLVLSLAALASDTNALEKTHPRDNTFCQVKGKRFEIMIRGEQEFTEPNERMWGEHVFLRLNSKTTRIPLTQNSGLYRLLSGNPSSCTKVIGTTIGKKFAVLFQKMNSPHKHLLIVQYLDPETLDLLETQHTPYMVDKAQIVSNGIVLRTHPPYRQEMEMGRVTIQEKKYLYQVHVFPVWVKLHQEGFTTDAAATFEEFPYRKYFTDENHFKEAAGWQNDQKNFQHTKLYVAVNHATKSKCILLGKENSALNGSENWVCQ